MQTPHDAPQFSTAEYGATGPGGHGMFVRGLLFGVGGALAGLILYAAVGIITGLEIGFVSLAVGWLVGKAIITGSRGHSGRRYQVAAVVLTYAAVSLSAIPIAISYGLRDATGVESTAGSDASAPAGGATPVSETTPAAANEAETPPLGLGQVVGTLLLLGLTSPFLGLTDMPGGLIGLFILAIGLQIAWKTAGGTAQAVRDALAESGPPDKPSGLGLGR